MNKDINLVEILKDVPKGTKLWSPLYGDLIFVETVDYNGASYAINCKAAKTNGEIHHVLFTGDGRSVASNHYANTECVLFPSRTNRDWANFKAPWGHKHLSLDKKS